MLFNSVSFLLFFPIVVIIYYALPHKMRPLFLLIASSYFYMCYVPKYILILFFLITLDYILGRAIQGSTGRSRKWLLIVSILSNLGTLFVFKYLNFFNENIAALAHLLNWQYSFALLRVALPLGLSFHVFQSLSYVIEVYKGRYKAEMNYIHYALYVMFFPQLVAGPIERPQNLLPQINTLRDFDFSRMKRGLERMLWGFFKKLVIADQISVIVDRLFSHLPSDSFSLVFLSVLFTYQLYCDFSGYSDIAIGSANVLGFDLVENFNRPFAAISVADFWRRWHISLSSWLRDYLYYPLAFSWGKVSKYRLYVSLFITFTLIGLWHGARMTFVVMGALHGMYLVVGSMTERFRDKFAVFIRLSVFPRMRSVLKILTVFSLVTISFIFFRAESVSQALWIIGHIFTGGYMGLKSLQGLGLVNDGRLMIFPAIIFMEVVQYVMVKKGTFYIFEDKPKIFRYAWRYALIFILLWFGSGAEQAFIYFQF